MARRLGDGPSSYLDIKNPPPLSPSSNSLVFRNYSEFIHVATTLNARLLVIQLVECTGPEPETITMGLELELILSRWLWERGEKGGASLQNKPARVRCVV